MTSDNRPRLQGDQTLELCVAQRDNIRAIFDSVEDAIFTVDAACKIGNANQSFLRMIGIKEQDAIGKDPNDLLKLRYHSLRDVCDRTLGGEALHGLEVSITPPKGGTILAILSSAPLRDRERELGGAVIVLHDMTRLRALEEDLKRAQGRGKLVGNNVRMREIYELIDQLADNDVTVLITGESGTGKELVAGAIHGASHRSKGPFIRVNCAALSETLLESELFGHVKGAFTGAVNDRIGRFEAANEGTIFLDEIGSVSEAVQQRLLRVLQEREFERVGDTQTRKADVRVIAATNADLRRLVDERRFREDLYYRLHVVEINLPPLRERKEDIPVLAEHLLAQHTERMGRSATTISSDAMAALMACRWDGNIRQLENAIQRALVVVRGRVIHREHLPPELVGMGESEILGRSGSFRHSDSEEADLRRALEEAGGDKGRAAEILGIHRTTFWRRMKKHNFE
ncbi:MAG: sigma 54-interacting transcriptional regulator [Candidatus Eisenbacteria bacterium]|uniref:Sigma 54-interacting transcriptional regulator n=1 Tax=Eiseniibacteriota bacterium TaxID=2212470 RepID=A0A948RYR3_UNCEI|nr:sigma 54-interacting transcriptional regulator [Candidatus Eisenbacteria bacterium]MBU1947391.1 sigma 54-interacting transcriptional regulator [Candidatus Eisenbacteria bacterium]MBU2692072.1 sigma 54-interacting transcriptional regulator [Candidatus Eisenbacteria bacterium]